MPKLIHAMYCVALFFSDEIRFEVGMFSCDFPIPLLLLSRRWRTSRIQLYSIDMIEETSEILGNSTSCPFESTNQDGILEICKFWIQGVLITLIGLFGITGNLVNSYMQR